MQPPLDELSQLCSEELNFEFWGESAFLCLFPHLLVTHSMVLDLSELGSFPPSVSIHCCLELLLPSCYLIVSESIVGKEGFD